jgi:hypothetical protein
MQNQPIQIKMFFSEINYKKKTIKKDFEVNTTNKHNVTIFQNNTHLPFNNMFNMYNIMTNTTSCGNCHGYE